MGDCPIEINCTLDCERASWRTCYLYQEYLRKLKEQFEGKNHKMTEWVK